MTEFAFHSQEEFAAYIGKVNTAVKEQEEALCGAVLRGGSDVYKKARDVVEPESFRNEPLSNLWTAFENLFSRDLKIDVFTVADELERMGCMEKFSDGPWSGRAYLSNVRGNGDPRNWQSYAENVADYAAKRKEFQIFQQALVWTLNGRRGEEIRDDVMTQLSRIQTYSVKDEYTVPISVGLSEAWDWIERASSGEVIGVPTGFTDLDEMLGALYPDNLYIVAGRPGTGKTAFVLSVVRHAAKEQTKRVALFSLEMSRAQIGQRLLAQEGEVDLHRMTKGTLLDEEWPKLTNAVGVIESLPIVVNDLSSININQIASTSRKLYANGGLDLIVVDYLQLADAPNKKKNQTREQEVSEIARGLKHLARELHVPVLAAAQLSRAVEQRANKKAMLSDLRESGSLEQDGYGIMFLNKVEDPNKQNVIEVDLAKHRNGPVGPCELIFRPEFTRFENASTRWFRPNKEGES